MAQFVWFALKPPRVLKRTTRSVTNCAQHNQPAGSMTRLTTPLPPATLTPLTALPPLTTLSPPTTLLFYNLPMSKTIVATPSAPAAIGPYVQAVRTGNLLFTSGQIPLDPATGELVAGGITEQATRALENLKAVLEAGGSSLAKVIKSTVYLKTLDDFAALNAVYGKYLAPEGVTAPARTTIAVAGLPKGALVEIELVAEV